MNQGRGALLDYYSGQNQQGTQLTGQGGAQLGMLLYDQYLKGAGTPSATSYSSMWPQTQDPFAGYGLPNLRTRLSNA